MIDKLYEAAYSILKNSIVLEMAIAKKQYGEKVFNIFHRVIEHYLLIKANPESTAVSHWKNEIVSFLAPIARSKYAHTKKYPKSGDFLLHVKESGHEYNPTGFEDIYMMLKSEKNLPSMSKSDFVKISKEFVIFLHDLSIKIERGQLITILDVK